MSYAAYVGRVGALAVALGIGMAVANMPVVAWAVPETGTDPSGVSGQGSSGQSPEQKDVGEGATHVDGGATPEQKEVAEGATPDYGARNGSGGLGVSGDPDNSGVSIGGIAGGKFWRLHPPTIAGGAAAKLGNEEVAETSEDRGLPERTRPRAQKPDGGAHAALAPSKPKRSVWAAPAPAPVPPSRNADGLNAKPRLSALGVSPSNARVDQVVQPRPVAKVAPVVRTAAVAPKVTASVVASPEPAPTSLMSRVLSLVTLTPGVGDVPPVRGESSLLLAILAKGRRLSQQDSVEESRLRVVDSPEISLMLVGDDEAGVASLAALVAVNSAPSGSVSVGVPNQLTGQIVGGVSGVDAEGNPLTYSVPTSGAGAPTKGTVSINRDTGAFTYQPSTGARLAAQSTSAPDFDTFTVNVSDGEFSTPVSVTVAVLPGMSTLAMTETLALGSGSNPSAVAVYGNRMYVANATARTVKVFNTDTNQVIATIPVQTSPTAIAVSPDGKSVWVANSGSRTVQRIDPVSNTVVATVTVGTTPTALAVTSDSVWVANAGSNSVSRINTTSNTVAATVTNVGSAPSAIAVSGDRVYVANKNGNSISVISTATNLVVQTKSSVTSPNGLAVTGGKVYVTQQSPLNRVLVLNASSLAQVATINVGAPPTSVAVTPDGAQAYVTTTNHRVSVINTATNAVASTTVVNTASGTGGHAVAVDGSATNGKVYITDAVNNSLRVLSLTRGNTAPVATANPSIDSTDPRERRQSPDH